MSVELTAWIWIGLAALVVLIVVAARFYERSTREVSLVKTGFGGRKVVMDGGTVALPYFHEVTRVNMQTLRLEVNRNGEGALITNDRLRVDVGAAFYVSVIPTRDGIARAAQTIGNRTFHPDRLRELIEGKLVDALRSVAARLTMDELHENRAAFVTEVRDGLAETLSRNGLELESVSLTALDQTPFEALDENNVFNAVGMRKLAEVIAKSKKERAEITADAEVSVRRAAMEAKKLTLQIELEEQEAEIAQIQQVETLKAAQVAEVVRHKADSERETALARINMEQAIREAEIHREREVQLAEQELGITLARKSQEESKAQGAADIARAQAVRDAEGITTARQVAEAERGKQIAVLAAQQEAEAAEIKSAARKKGALAEAEGRKAMIEAENKIDSRIATMKVELAKIEAAPRLVAEMVKPAEKIDSIKIHQISGLGGGQGSGAGGQTDRPAVSRVMDSILEMAVQLPALKKIGEEIGHSLESSLSDITPSTLPLGKPATEKPPGKENS